MNEKNFMAELPDEEQQEIPLGSDLGSPDELNYKTESYHRIMQEELPNGMDNIDFVMAFAKVLNPNFNLSKEGVIKRLKDHEDFSEVAGLFNIHTTEDGGIEVESIDKNDQNINLLLQETIKAVKNGINFGGDWSTKLKEITEGKKFISKE